MYRFIILLISAFVPVVALQAQSAIALNGLTRSTELPTTAVTPHTPKVTESPFYVKVSGFYGLLTPGVRINYSEAVVASGSAQPFKTTSKGLGGGARGGIGVGLILSDFINIGVDAEVLFGAPIKIDIGFEDGVAKSTTTATTTLNVVSVIPNITFKALSRPTYYIYNRLGLVGGMVLQYKTVNSYVDRFSSGSVQTKESTNEYTKNSLALGYQAALGIQFRLSQRIRAFAEVVAYNQSFKPKRLEYTPAATTAGAASVQVTEYIDQGVEVPNTNPTTRKPQTGQQQSFTVPMNSIGVGAGITFRF